MDKPTSSRSNPEARRAYTRWHYSQNKAAYKERARAKTTETRAAIRAWIHSYLEGKRCVDCGEHDPIVLEFDHREPGSKRFTIASASRGGFSLRSVQQEVEKCDVRCANCHRRITYVRAGRTHRGVANTYELRKPEAP